MNALTTLHFVRRWLPLLLLGPLLGGAAGYLVVREVPSVYEADVTLLVQAGEPAISGGQDSQTAQDLAQTYAEAMRTRSVLTEAAAQAGMGSLSLLDLQNRVHARRVSGTQLLRLSAEHTDPEQAARLANTVAQVFVSKNAENQASRFDSSRENLARLVDQLQADIDDRAFQIAAVQAQPSSVERDAQLGRLQSDLTQLQAAHSATLRSYEDLRIGQARAANSLTVLDPAVPPGSPIRPNRLLTTLVAALAGLLVAAGIPALAEYLDDRLRDGERVAAATGLSTLALVPRRDTTPSSLRDPSGRRATESYRLLRSKLQFATAGGPLHTLLIASAALGEGKSTTAAHLAVVLAEADQRVILVDADLHRPTLALQFGLPNRSGLSTLLLDDRQPVRDALRATWLPNLHVLPAGPAQPEASALLSSKRWTAVLGELRDICDVLVIDTPPLLAQPDAALLSSHVDAVLFVIDASRSRGRQAARALEMLRGSGAPVVGAVVNRIPKSSIDHLAYESYRDQGARASGTPTDNGHWDRTPSSEVRVEVAPSTQGRE